MDEIAKASEEQEERLREVQTVLRRMSFTASDEEEQVEVRVSGDGRIRQIEIDASLLKGKPEELAQVIVEAANSALQEARTGAIERLSERGAEIAGAGDLLARQRP